MEYRHETVARLRKALGREPTDDEVKADRDAQWRKQLQHMMWTDLMFRDEKPKE
jgi:hypothetical protein